MRIRSIKPEFYRSEDIAKLSRVDRLLFIGLWSYVDDNGVGVDDYRLIKADLFPLEDEVEHDTYNYIREGLATLHRHLLLARYEVNSRSYLYILSWDFHQRIDRPGKPRFPRPDEPLTSDDDPTHARPSRVSRETLAPGVRNRGTEEQGSSTTTRPQAAEPAGLAADLFEKFWSAYPRKIRKLHGRKAWDAAVRRGVDPAHIVEAAQRYADSARTKDVRFVPHPTTWLNGGAYDDKPEPPPMAKQDRRIFEAMNRVQNQPLELGWKDAAS